MSTEGESLSGRVGRAGYVGRRSGEKGGRNGSRHDAHSSLLRSPAHRAHMLAADLTHVGIGVALAGVLSGDRIFVVTQVFSVPRRQLLPEELRELVRSRLIEARAQASRAELESADNLDRVADHLALMVREGGLPGGGLVVAAQRALADSRVRWETLFVESLELHDTAGLPPPQAAGERLVRRAGIGVATVDEGDRWPMVAVVLLVGP